jgi:hypothetical protein
MGPDADQGGAFFRGPAPAVELDPPVRGRGRHSVRTGVVGPGPSTTLVPPSPWLTVLAFAVVAVPFAVALVRLASASGAHVYLPDDLALIDLHTRRALQWKQQLGVFDHNEWNHPGPTYFYLLSVVYRVLGSGAKAMFVGATLINAGAALACVGVVRRRASPARALWAAVWLCVLASLLAAVGPGSVAYSEGALGGLVSPWNPMVVIFPLVLLFLLCAGAMDRSPLSLVAAVVVGSFIVQTNVSALPLVVVATVAGALAWVATVVVDHRRHRPVPGPDRPDPDPDPGVVAAADSTADAGGPTTASRRVRVWAALGGVAFVLMWLPPVIQQLTNHPGNFTLLYRFFTAPNPGHSLHAALTALVAVDGIVTVGPSEVMHASVAATPHHQVLAVATTVVLLLVAAVTVVVGWRQRLRFATGIGLLGLAGSATLVWAVTHLEGHPYGYLVVWAVAVPVSSLIGAGMLRWPLTATVTATAPGPAPAGQPPFTSRGWVRSAACAVAVAVSVVVCVRVVAIPGLDAVSDPQVGQLRALVVPSLTKGATVFVNDSGAGADDLSRLLDVERFVGLVNLLDEGGYHPKVNQVWRAELGPGFEADGHEERSIELSTWTPSSPGKPGYLGRVGDLAVTLLSSHDPADSPG